MPLLAEDNVVTVQDAFTAWAPFIANVGIAGWVLWYCGTKLIPKFMESNEKLVTAFREEAKAEREHHTQSVLITHERINGLGEKVDELTAAVNSK